MSDVLGEALNRGGSEQEASSTATTLPSALFPTPIGLLRDAEASRLLIWCKLSDHRADCNGWKTDGRGKLGALRRNR
jgi:hypothetical protein